MASTAHPEDPDPERSEGEGDEGSKDEEIKWQDILGLVRFLLKKE